MEGSSCEKPNGWLSDARNFGISHSTGDLITFLDQDDIRRKGKLAEQVGCWTADLTSVLLRSNLVVASSALFRRKAAELAGPSNRQYVAAPDYEYFLRFALCMDSYFIDKPLVYCRHHDANTVKREMRLFFEGISILMDARLSGSRQVLLASSARLGGVRAVDDQSARGRDGCVGAHCRHSVAGLPERESGRCGCADDAAGRAGRGSLSGRHARSRGWLRALECRHTISCLQDVAMTSQAAHAWIAAGHSTTPIGRGRFRGSR